MADDPRPIDIVAEHLLALIFEWIVDEQEKIVVVSRRFRTVFLQPKWYQEWYLVLDPFRIRDLNHIPDEVIRASSANRPRQQNVITLDHKARRAVIPNKDALDATEIPWREFGWLDLYINATDDKPLSPEKRTQLWELIRVVLPQFSDVEVSPAERKLDDPITLDMDSFQIHSELCHFSLYGLTNPRLETLTPHLSKVRYLELNSIRNNEDHWLNAITSTLPQISILDLWRCEWKQETDPVVLPTECEVVRIAYCTKNLPVDLMAVDRVRVINMDIEQLVCDQFIHRLYDYVTKISADNVAIVAPHMDHNPTNCISMLEKLKTVGIMMVYLPKTDDEVKYTEMKNLITEAASLVGEMNLMYSKPPEHFYANSPNYRLYRRLKAHGRLAGTISW